MCKSRARRHETYGLTREELNLLLAQHDVCAICGTAAWGKKGPQVDHCHATGAVRGVLCTSCNNGLGRFKDDPERLESAAAYLRRSRAD
ncbi:MAG: endonuclease VII domain-containing protein [Acidimicrobiia bacterium]